MEGGSRLSAGATEPGTVDACSLGEIGQLHRRLAVPRRDPRRRLPDRPRIRSCWASWGLPGCCPFVLLVGTRRHRGRPLRPAADPARPPTWRAGRLMVVLAVLVARWTHRSRPSSRSPSWLPASAPSSAPPSAPTCRRSWATSGTSARPTACGRRSTTSRTSSARPSPALLIAAGGLGIAFLLNALSFGFVALVLLTLPPGRPAAARDGDPVGATAPVTRMPRVTRCRPGRAILRRIDRCHRGGRCDQLHEHGPQHPAGPGRHRPAPGRSPGRGLPGGGDRGGRCHRGHHRGLVRGQATGRATRGQLGGGRRRTRPAVPDHDPADRAHRGRHRDWRRPDHGHRGHDRCPATGTRRPARPSHGCAAADAASPPCCSGHSSRPSSLRGWVSGWCSRGMGGCLVVAGSAGALILARDGALRARPDIDPHRIELLRRTILAGAPSAQLEIAARQLREVLVSAGDVVIRPGTRR